MSLTLFTLTATYRAVISDGADVDGGDPDIQNITATAMFEPSVSEVIVGGVTYRLQPVTARLDEDGQLHTIHGDLGARLVAGSDDPDSPLHGLTYLVRFSNVNYDKRRGTQLNPIRFVAPTSDVTVDITEVTRVAIR